jgi:putative transposase
LSRPGRHRPRSGTSARLGTPLPLGPFTGSLAWLGIADSPAFLGEPETNGCAERWIRTLNDQCLWVQLHDTIDELRQAVTDFVERYNSSWRIQRHGHRTPKEAYQTAQAAAAA